jgi:hypothetical protein
VQLFGASDLSVEQRGESDPPFDADIRRREIAGLRARMGETAYRAAYERGRSLTAAEALTLALAAD